MPRGRRGVGGAETEGREEKEAQHPRCKPGGENLRGMAANSGEFRFIGLSCFKFAAGDWRRQ